MPQFLVQIKCWFIFCVIVLTWLTIAIRDSFLLLFNFPRRCIRKVIFAKHWRELQQFPKSLIGSLLSSKFSYSEEPVVSSSSCWIFPSLVNPGTLPLLGYTSSSSSESLSLTSWNAASFRILVISPLDAAHYTCIALSTSNSPSRLLTWNVKVCAGHGC